MKADYLSRKVMDLTLRALLGVNQRRTVPPRLAHQEAL